MYTLIINDVPEILKLGQAKGTFLQVDTWFLLSQGLKDLSNMLQVFFPTLVEDEDVV